jgi:hypothetical protein
VLKRRSSGPAGPAARPAEPKPPHPGEVEVNAFRLVRLLRTLSSEIYVIWQGDQRVGQADVHYADNSIQADLLLESALDEEDLKALVRQLDDDVVASYLPSFDRDQFIVTVFIGQEVDSFNFPQGDELDGN